MIATATNNQQLMLQLDASVELLRRNLARGEVIVGEFERKATRDVDRFDDRLRRVGMQGLPNLERGLSFAGNALKGFAVGIVTAGAAAAGHRFLEIADEAKQIDAQLTLATRTFGNFSQAQADAQRIAADTRSSLSATTSLYGNFLRSSEQTGRSQAQAARATETFSKVLKIGGADANAAASATLQFGQALASGALRGDEFNSIAEASPRILKLLADSLDVPQGAVRKLAEEGKLTSDVLYKALTERKFTDAIDEEFRTLPKTFGEAVEQVNNAAITAFGAFDRGGEFSTAIANFVTDGADGFRDLADGAEQLGIDTRAILSGLHDAFEPMVQGALSAFGLIGDEAYSLKDDIADSLGLLDRMVNEGIASWNQAASAARTVTFSLLPGGAGMYPGVLPDTPIGYRSNMRDNFRRGAENSRIVSNARRLERENDKRFSNNNLPASAQETLDWYRGEGRFAPRRRTIAAPAGGTGGRRRSARGGGSRRSAQRDPLAELRSDLETSTYKINADLTEDGAGDLSKWLTQAGQDADRFLEEQVGLADRARDYRLEIEDEIAAAKDRLVEKERLAIYDSANLFETLFREGSTGLWEQFKAEGLRAVALIAAALIQGKSISAAIGIAGESSSFGSLLGFGGGRANGGGVSPGAWYQVGERGPEAFVPSVPGTILPTSVLRGGMGGSGAPIHFDLSNAVLTAELLVQMEDMANRTGGRLIGREMKRRDRAAERTFGGR